MNRRRTTGLTAIIVIVFVSVAGFELGLLGGSGSSSTRTTTSSGLNTSTQVKQSVKVTTLGNQIFYTFDFCSIPTGAMPPDWVSYKNKPGWSVQACNLAYEGTSVGYVGAYYSGRLFSNFTLSLNTIALGNCPSNPNALPGGQLPPVMYVTFGQQSTKVVNEYYFRFDIQKVEIEKYVNGYESVLALRQTSYPLLNNGTFDVTLSVNGGLINASWYGPLNNGGITQGSIWATDSTFSTGWIGVATYNCDAAFSNLHISAPAR